MSRYPFRECVNEVMRQYRGNRAESTLEVMERRYNRMEKDLNLLKSQGRISTTSPKYLTVKDIAEYHEFLKTRLVNGGHVCNDSIKKDFIDLDKLCSFYGNRCIDDYRAMCPSLSSRKNSSRLPVMTDADIGKVLKAAAEVPSNDFWKLRAYALVALYTGAGLRTVEMVHAKAANIEISDGVATIYLDHVKGNDTYGEPRTAFIIPRFIPAIERYLVVRQRYLDSREETCEYLFFSHKDLEMLTDKSIRAIRGNVEEACGLKFDGRMCRRTYGQYLKDRGVSIENVSVNMGHNSTKTTERYYARQRSERAILETVGSFIDGE